MISISLSVLHGWTAQKASEGSSMAQSVAVASNGFAYHDTAEDGSYRNIVDDICGLHWGKLNSAEILRVAHAYYYFSIQFRENLEVALELYPDDANLQQLYQEECDTDNLSPWPQI